MTKRVNVLGVGISVLNLRTALDAIADAVRERRKGYICVTGVHGVMEAQDDAGFQTNPEPRVSLHARRHADGLGRKAGRPSRNEPGLWPGFDAGRLRLERNQRLQTFFLRRRGRRGGIARAEIESKVSETGSCRDLHAAVPRAERGRGNKIAGTNLRRQPDILWVGLSTPKQEKFMAEFLPKLDVTLMIGVGAAFDFHSGRVRQAPRWMQRSGLEWFYRLCCEPRRLAKRYFRNNPLFVLEFFRQLTGLKKHPSP